MNLGIGFEQKQTQTLSQALLQSINTLALPTTELRETILRELDSNPTLEVAEDRSEEKMYRRQNKKNYETIKHKNQNAADAHQSFLESIPDSGESLQTHLLKQFRLLPLAKNESAFGELLIQNLDASGFMIVKLDELLPLFNQNREDTISRETAKKICADIQRLDPVGCCTDNELNSLACQAKILFSEKITDDKIYFYVLDILQNHQALFKVGNKTNFFTELKKVGGDYASLTFTDSKKILECIATLDLHPGKKFSSTQTAFAVPEIFIIKTEDGFKAELNDVEIPVLQVSSIFREKNNGAKQNEQLKDALQKANQFIESLNYRRETMLKVAAVLLLTQKKFFEKGKAYLEPLTQTDVANELNVSPSTISRTVNGKYLQCDWGVFELAFFFSSEVSTFGKAQTNQVSKNAVKAIIQNLLETDPKLTDAAITEKLHAEGIRLSRRTVNKYRNELKR